jgi:8-oxo-dGTP pyrophosphatase MutT (NUDIX family)
MTISRSEADRFITIVAAVIENEAGHVLLVRKEGTHAFMLPGGKIDPGESLNEALKRELLEELGCPVHSEPAFFGEFVESAANEPDYQVHGTIFTAGLAAEPRACAEIADMRWHDPALEPDFTMAPLARFRVFPALLAARKAA